MDSQQMQRQLWALGQDKYSIAKMRLPDGASRPLRIEDVLTVEEIIRKESRFNIDIQNGENLYIRALPDINHEIIFIDDSTPIASEFLKEQGIAPCCIVQSSTDDDGVPRLHCWYRMPAPFDCPTRKAVERVIINRLHEQFPHPDKKKRPGDTGSNDGCHFGRLAGTWNFGLGKERDEAVTLIEATSHVLSQDVAGRLLEEAAPFIDYAPKIRKQDCNLSEIIEHQYENPKIARYFLENVMPKMNPQKEHYQQDLFAAGKLYDAKFSELDIKKVLFEHDPNPISERKAGREAYFLENILREVKKEPLLPEPETPSTTECGGEVFMHLRELASASSPDQLNAGADAPAQAKPAEPPKFTGFGTITKDGKVLFNVEKNGTSTFPENKGNNQQIQTTTGINTTIKRPVFNRPRLGVRPRTTTRPLPSPSPKP